MGGQTGRLAGDGGASGRGLWPSSLCANSFSYTLAHVAERFHGDLVVLRWCRCIHKPLHTSASHSSQLSAFAPLPAVFFFFFSFFCLLPISYAHSGWDFFFFLLFTLDFPEALLAWRDKERTFLFTFCTNLKRCVAKTC